METHDRTSDPEPEGGNIRAKSPWKRMERLYEEADPEVWDEAMTILRRLATGEYRKPWHLGEDDMTGERR